MLGMPQRCVRGWVVSDITRWGSEGEGQARGAGKCREKAEGGKGRMAGRAVQ